MFFYLYRMICKWCENEILPREHMVNVSFLLNGKVISESTFHFSCYKLFIKPANFDKLIKEDKNAVKSNP